MIQIMELVVSTTAMNFCFDIWVTFLVFILISAHSPLFKFLVIFRLFHINNSIITPFPLTPLHSTPPFFLLTWPLWLPQNLWVCNPYFKLRESYIFLLIVSQQMLFLSGKKNPKQTNKRKPNNSQWEGTLLGFTRR